MTKQMENNEKQNRSENNFPGGELARSEFEAMWFSVRMLMGSCLLFSDPCIFGPARSVLSGRIRLASG